MTGTTSEIDMGRRKWRSAVTVSLVPEARGGPFVFWDSLPDACSHAQQLGFSAIEIFAPQAGAIDPAGLAQLLNEFDLQVAAFGTGAGWLLHKLSLTDPQPTVRAKAVSFVAELIALAGSFEAPVIIGSMQGRWGGDVSRDQALEWLAEGLSQLSQLAQPHGVPVLYEPLNRYETNLCNTLAQAVDLLERHDLRQVQILADLFHMNIEETDLADAIRSAASWIGHIHFVDSNRRAAGWGHINFSEVMTALEEIEYHGYLSAEAFSWPDPHAAARQTMAHFRRLTGPSTPS